MSFKPIRTFLEDRLLETDSDFEVFDQAFNNDNIGDADFNKRYHIFYGPVSASVSNQNTTQDNVTATVTLYFRGYRDTNESLDEAMDIANEYRINCLRVIYLKNQTHIKRVVCTSISPEQMQSNDLSFKVILTFNISMIFGTNINLDC